MNNYEKTAEEPLTVPERFLMSAMIGGGSFGAMRLLTDMINRINKPKVYDNSIRLMTPDPMDKVNNPGDAASSTTPNFEEGKIAGWANDVMAVGTGLPAGFLGTKYLYDSYTDSQGKQKVDSAKKKYLAKLQEIQEDTAKQASETPCVDGFCEVLALQLNKQALEVDAATKLGLKPGWQDAINHSPEAAALQDKHRQAALWSKIKGMFGFAADLPYHAGQTGKILAAGGLAATLGGLIYANKEKREKERKLMYPDKVTFA